MKKIKVAVAHAAWGEGRKEGLDRLIEVLQENRKFLPNGAAIGT